MQRVKNAIGVGRVIAMHRNAVRDISARKSHVAGVGSDKGEALEAINSHLVLGVFRSGRGPIEGLPAEGVGARDKYVDDLSNGHRREFLAHKYFFRNIWFTPITASKREGL